MMCEEDVFPRALQNHLLQIKHFTTQEGEWIPQYAQECAGSSVSSSISTGPSPSSSP
jgi:hypothetical protein